MGEQKRRIADAIDKAIERLQSGGWYQGTYVPQDPAVPKPMGVGQVYGYLASNPDMPCCGAAALMFGCEGDFGLYDKTSGWVRRFVPPTPGLRWTSLPTWQDTEGRDVWDVVALLAQARDAARAA